MVSGNSGASDKVSKSGTFSKLVLGFWEILITVCHLTYFPFVIVPFLPKIDY